MLPTAWMECEWWERVRVGHSVALGRLGRGSEVGTRPVPRTENEVVQVLLGAHSLSKPGPSKHLYDVQSAVPHPGSRPDTIEDDVLLLKVRLLGPSYS